MNLLLNKEEMEKAWQSLLEMGEIAYEPSKASKRVKIGPFVVIIIPARWEKDRYKPELRFTERVRRTIFQVFETPFGKWGGTFNRYPIEHLHFLLVPWDDNEQKFQERPQLLEENDLKAMFYLAQSFPPEWVIFYQSFGGGASINNIHFNALELPPCLLERNLIENYPVVFFSFKDVEKAWALVAACQEGRIPINLLIRNEKIYVIPRRKDKTKNWPRERLIGVMEMVGFCVTDEIRFIPTEEQLWQIIGEVGFPCP